MVLPKLSWSSSIFESSRTRQKICIHLSRRGHLSPTNMSRHELLKNSYVKVTKIDTLFTKILFLCIKYQRQMEIHVQNHFRGCFFFNFDTNCTSQKICFVQYRICWCKKKRNLSATGDASATNYKLL